MRFMLFKYLHINFKRPKGKNFTWQPFQNKRDFKYASNKLSPTTTQIKYICGFSLNTAEARISRSISLPFMRMKSPLFDGNTNTSYDKTVQASLATFT